MSFVKVINILSKSLLYKDICKSRNCTSIVKIFTEFILISFYIWDKQFSVFHLEAFFLDQSVDVNNFSNGCHSLFTDVVINRCK
jgi:hypothetical protein